MWRNRLALLALLLLAVGVLPPASSLYGVTGEESLLAQIRGFGQWIYTSVRPPLQLAPSAVETHDVSPFAINTFLELEVEPEKRLRSLQEIEAAGFGMIRQQFTWSDIEIQGKNDFEDCRNPEIGCISAWLKYDNIVDLAEQQGLEILARLDHPPAWSRALPPEESGYFGPPDHVTDYGDYVAAVANRYQGRIRFYQLWNEPNIYPEWGEQTVSPEDFVPFLCEGYARIKAIDPQALVVAPAVSPTIALNYRDLNNLVYLQRLYDAGGGACFDILAAQGYGLFSGAQDYRLRPTVINYPHHLFLRDVMVVNGDSHKPIWITELGWNTVPDDLPPAFGQVNLEQQGRYAVEAYQRLQADWPWVEVGGYWFYKRPSDSEIDQPFYYFRLVEPDFTPMPAYEMVQDYLTEGAAFEPRPSWWYGWQAVRHWLVLSGAGYLFWYVLTGLWIGQRPEDR